MSPSVKITQHTTASTPRPHVLYSVQATLDGAQAIVDKRYSEFVALHDALKVTKYSLPPKRLLVTTFLPSAWLDDVLIAERKAGLGEYLDSLVQDPEYTDDATLREFLSPSTAKASEVTFNPEDALPSTLGRKAALAMMSDSGEIHTEATRKIAGAYYPTWSAWSNPPEGLNYSKFDILFVAFVTVNSNQKLAYEKGTADILRRLVSSAKASGKGTKIVLSVGGWSGSYWFSDAVSTSAKRATFVAALARAVKKYGLDGIDIDWEYPNSNGAGHPFSSTDSANLLKLFQGLRASIGSKKIISSAVAHMPWLGTNGSPLKNVAAYAEVMTYVNIMNYDVWGSSSTPGPNAPLGDLCGTSWQPQANAKAALKQWTAAGFPASKLLLGLPLYGYVSNSTKTGLTGSFAPMIEAEMNAPPLVQGEYVFPAHPRPRDGAKIEYEDDDDDDASGLQAQEEDVATVQKTADLRQYYGQAIPFNTLLASGALVRKADGSYGEGGGFTMGWDNCSDTPFLYNIGQSTVVTYDDTYSLGTKAKFARDSGMAGCFTWSLDQDDGVRLQNAIIANL